ncbi:transglutaminase family protein [Amycolatopsis sp. NPDC059657]|uniref:transglutaminase-like domain-containing protein n=1 Tax=Amycolatopsis sp. NPDC059657 TaxID=3346899 RepID=UPI003670A6C0
MRCLIDAEVALTVTVPGRVAFTLAAAAGADREELTLSDGFAPEVVDFAHGTRTHVFDLPARDFSLRYQAECEIKPAEPQSLTTADLAIYTRPSRYCPTDRMGFAMAEFGTLADDRSKVDAIVRYVHDRMSYVVGAGSPLDDAVDRLLAGEGVCRDFAHICVALCRVIDIPARYVSVYAPGLSPMDFHAVFEAAIDGYWYVFDATRLAPRQSLVRVATGRDAADTAFVATLGGSEIDFRGTGLFVTAEPELPEDDGSALIPLAGSAPRP